ncbi:MAG: hypothetical protein J6O51_09645 [Bacteroidales bacterium]|nr:hypothetical protein [Bacteroidales bacterium]
MSVKYKKIDAPVYVAPDCDVCKLLSDVIICQSAETEDWTYDENGDF